MDNAKQRKRIPRKRSKPRRKRPDLPELAHQSGHGERLHGAAKTARRREIFERARGRCEEMIPFATIQTIEGPMTLSGRCGKPATEWSHLRHGANKCDCLSPKCSIASCKECHQKRHAGGNGKPVPKKPTDAARRKAHDDLVLAEYEEGIYDKVTVETVEKAREQL